MPILWRGERRRRALRVLPCHTRVFRASKVSSTARGIRRVTFLPFPARGGRRLRGTCCRLILAVFRNQGICYCPLSHFATTHGSKRTHVPMRNEGMRPAFA